MSGKHGKGITPEELQAKADAFDNQYNESKSHDPGYRKVGEVTVADDPEANQPRKRW